MLFSVEVGLWMNKSKRKTKIELWVEVGAWLTNWLSSCIWYASDGCRAQIIIILQNIINQSATSPI